MEEQPMSETECSQKVFEFHALGQREVVARFDGGRITSDGGGLLLRETERLTGIIRQFSACFTDHRDPELIEHTVEELVGQRVYGLASGYEDLNDHDELRHDPMLAVLVGNPRFVVTSLSAEDYPAQILYEQEYCGRGDMENRIKEQQLYLFADRTSAGTMRANQLRLWLSSVAYTLLLALRRLGLKKTPMARAQCDTIRLKLLKIGAQIRVTVRKVWVSLTESCPYQSLFTRVYERLRRQQPVPLRC
jgi:hypothetical protein